MRCVGTGPCDADAVLADRVRGVRNYDRARKKCRRAVECRGHRGGMIASLIRSPISVTGSSFVHAGCGNVACQGRNAVYLAPPRDPKPPRMPGLRAAAVPSATITWKLRIPWKLRMHIACFISTGCEVSTLTPPARPRWLDLYPACGPQGHHGSFKLTELCRDRASRRRTATVLRGPAHRRRYPVTLRRI